MNIPFPKYANEEYKKRITRGIEKIDCKYEGLDIADVLDLPCFGYSSEIEQDVIRVMECVNNRLFLTDIVEELYLDDGYIELIQYIICSVDLADYGTSPRGCWLTDYGKYILLYMKLAYERKWEVMYEGLQ